MSIISDDEQPFDKYTINAIFFVEDNITLKPESDMDGNPILKINLADIRNEEDSFLHFDVEQVDELIIALTYWRQWAVNRRLLR